MTAQTIDFGVRNSAFVFNAQDKDHRVSIGEKLSSISVVPANWDGKRTFSLAPNAGFEELRAGITGAIEFHYELTVVDGAYHWYADLNPNKVGGSKGYVDLARFEALPEDGERKIERRIWMGSEWQWVKFPSKFVYEDPKTGRLHANYFKGCKAVKVVSIETKFALVKGMGPNRLELSNSIIDEKYGTSLADLKHNIIAMLADGIKVTVPVTLGGEFKDEDGSVKPRDSRLQNRALWLKGVIEAKDANGNSTYDWAKTREAIIADRILYHFTKQADAEVKRVAPELWEDPTQRAEVVEDLDRRVNGTQDEDDREVPTITLDGTIVPITKVQAGTYRVIGRNGSTRYPQVSVSKFGGAAKLRVWSREGSKLETISTF